jgi:hypothetical protein
MASWDRKLERTEEHLRALAKAIETFIATDPYAVTVKKEADGAEHVYCFSKFTDPPDSIGILAGDAVHNLRSALDHIVFASAQQGARAAGTTMSRSQERSIQFPITSSTEQFEDQIGRHRLRYVEPEIKTFIERLQPYWLSPGQPDRSWIAIINELDVIDKHRTIPALGTVVSYYAFTAPAGMEQPEIIPSRVTTGWGLDAEIVRYRFSEPHPEVDLEFNPTFTVSLDGAWPPTRAADVLLRGFAQHVRDLVIDPLDLRLNT